MIIFEALTLKNFISNSNRELILISCLSSLARQQMSSEIFRTVGLKATQFTPVDNTILGRVIVLNVILQRTTSLGRIFTELTIICLAQVVSLHMFGQVRGSGVSLLTVITLEFQSVVDCQFVLH